MSKIIINIKTLNLTVDGAQRAGGPSALISSLIHSIIASATEPQNESTGATGETTRVAGLSPNVAAPYGQDTGAGETAAQSDASAEGSTLDAILEDRQEFSPTMVLNHDNILIVLRSDDRFTKRTLEAVAKSFPDETQDAVASVLYQMIVDGKVKQLTRRRDGTKLYEALVPVGLTSDETAAPAETTAVEAAAETPAAPELNTDNVLNFLESDPRYNKRTIGAIAKHFGSTSEQVEAVLTQLDDEGEVEVTTRRRDGAKLYEAA